MPTTKAKKSKPVENPPAKAEGKPKSLWSLHGGVEDVSFQRSAPVTLWSVMGGLEAGVLLTQASVLWDQLQTGRWYLSLYFLNSLLIIALIWAESSWGSLVLKWTIAIPTILTQFLGNFALAVACLLVTNPMAWLFAVAISAVNYWVQQIQFMKSGGWEPFSEEYRKELRTNLWVYGLWPLICFAGALQLFLVPNNIAEAVWGVILLAVIIDALFRTHRGMIQEREEFGIS